MTNEYGTTLDRNGYAPTIMQRAERCYMCGRTGVLQRHEIYGSAYRDKSKALGLWVLLCPACHYDLHHVHAEQKMWLREHGQKRAVQRYGWSENEFRERFGRSYL
jgi:hypothetical protein